ncbi:MAG: hypothetical protein ACRC0G_09400, partial [Fusobacteriaceae bacterium]
ADGYVKKMEQLSDLDFALLPKEIGGNSSQYYCDHLWSHRKTQTNIARFGGLLDDGSLVGFSCWSLYNVASLAHSTVGGRLVFLKS